MYLYYRGSVFSSFSRELNLHRQRRFRDRRDPLAMYDKELMARLGFPRHVLAGLKSPHSQKQVTVVNCFARFYATGIFFASSTVLHGISDALCAKANHIKFPKTDNKLKEVAGFYRLREIPNICSAIDGSQISIKRLTVNEHVVHG